MGIRIRVFAQFSISLRSGLTIACNNGAGGFKEGNLKVLTSVVYPQGKIKKCGRKSLRFLSKIELLTLACMAAVVIIGFRMFQSAPIDVYPDINPPRITILTEAHGWSPEEMETLVTLPIESSMNGAPYVTRVRSSSAIGLSLVFVEFDWGTDVFLARQMVSERLQLVAPTLPEGVDAPIILPTSSLLGEIMEYALVDETGEFDEMEMRDLADWVIRYQPAITGGYCQCD